MAHPALDLSSPVSTLKASGTEPTQNAAVDPIARKRATSTTFDPFLDTILTGRYHLKKRIGRGAMGAVYAAEQLYVNRPVAVKLLLPDLATDSALSERFLREARMLAMLDHENVVRVFDAGRTDEGCAYFAMELLDGQDLASLLKDKGALRWQAAVKIAVQICRGLSHAHARGVIHRDIKPANVFLLRKARNGEQVKVLDFGVARAGAAALTGAGAIIGTPAYMAPEQLQSEEYDHRTDVYSVGCVLYEMLTGVLPHAGSTVINVLMEHLYQVPELPSKRAPARAIPPEVEAVVMKALAKTPGERWASMHEIELALLDASAGDLFGDEKTAQLPSDDILGGARDAYTRGDLEGAFDAVERAVIAAGSLEAGALRKHDQLFTQIYGAVLGNQDRILIPGVVPPDLDSRSAFLLSRADGDLTLADLVDVSGMPRLEAQRTLAVLIRRGVLVPA